MNKILFLVFVFSISLMANSVVSVDTILWNGNSLNHIDMVITNDGYTTAEVNNFSKDLNVECTDLSQTSTCGHARQAFDKIFSISPFLEYKNLFNVIVITTESNNSGMGEQDDSSFDSYYGVYETGYRGIIHAKTEVMNSTLALYAVNNDKTIVISNKTNVAIGYSNINTTYQTIGSSFPGVVVHEIGHSIGTLTDTYMFASVNESGNVTKSSNPSTAPWSAWIGESYNNGQNQVGMFPEMGMLSTQFYKPCEIDFMNSSFADLFCPATKEVIVKRFQMNIFNLMYDFSPSLGNVNITTASTIFSSNVMEPSPNTMKILWTLNGVAISELQDSSIDLCVNQLNVGSNTLSVKATDQTDFIKGTYRWGLTYTWYINYSGGLDPNDCSVPPTPSSSSAIVVPPPTPSSSSAIVVPPPTPSSSSTEVISPTKVRAKWNFNNIVGTRLYDTTGIRTFKITGEYDIKDDNDDIYPETPEIESVGSIINTKNYYTCSELEDDISDLLQPNKSWAVSGWFKKTNRSGYLLSRSGNYWSDRSAIYVIKHNNIIRALGGSRVTISTTMNEWNHFFWQNQLITGEWKDQIYVNGNLTMDWTSHGLTLSNYKLKIGCRGSNVLGKPILPLLGGYSRWNFNVDSVFSEVDIQTEYELMKQ